MTKWPTPPLGSLVETIVPARDKPTSLDGEIPWVRIEDFGGKYISGSKSGQGVTPETISTMPLRLFPAGTVVCTCSCSMGTTAIVTRPLVTNQTFIGLVPRPAGITSDFLYWLLQGHREQLTASADGAIQSYLSRDDFRSLRVPVPPIPTQRAIADYLDRETARIDALITAKTGMVELLEERAQATVERLVWWDQGTTRPLTQLRRMAVRIDVGIAEAATHAYVDAGVPLLRSTNIRPNRLESDDLLFIAPWFAERNRSKYVHARDILTVRTGAVGVSAVVPLSFDMSQCFTQLITTVRRPNLPEFVCYALNSGPARSYFRLTGWGSAQSNISVPLLAGAPIPVADVSQQAKLVARIEQALAHVSQMTRRLERQITVLHERRQALVTAAVTGELDMPESA